MNFMSKSSMPIVVGKPNPPDIPAGPPRFSDQPGPAARPEWREMTGNGRKNEKQPLQIGNVGSYGPSCRVAETRRDCPDVHGGLFAGQRRVGYNWALYPGQVRAPIALFQLNFCP